MTKREAAALIYQHVRWLEEPPIINGTGRIQKLCEALRMAIDALQREDYKERKSK